MATASPHARLVTPSCSVAPKQKAAACCRTRAPGLLLPVAYRSSPVNPPLCSVYLCAVLCSAAWTRGSASFPNPEAARCDLSSGISLLGGVSVAGIGHFTCRGHGEEEGGKEGISWQRCSETCEC